VIAVPILKSVMSGDKRIDYYKKRRRRILLLEDCCYYGHAVPSWKQTFWFVLPLEE
jgi:hypothetical protein